jgi:hypothetical protein
MPDYKALGYTHVYRTPQGQLWGIKLIASKPVWHRIYE